MALLHSFKFKCSFLLENC